MTGSTVIDGIPLGQRSFWPALFLILVLPLGIFLAVKVPPGHVPDESAHLVRADGLLFGSLVGWRERDVGSDGQPAVSAGVLADPALAEVMTLPIHVGTARYNLTSEMDSRARSIRWSVSPTFVGLGTIAGYMPLFYVPAAAAVQGAKSLGLTPLQAFIAVRLVNLLLFVGMGTAALWLAQSGHALLFCTLTVPMTLNLAASASQDGLLIAAAVLAAALVTHTPAHWAAVALISAIAMAKPPYLPLAALLLLPLPPSGRWQAYWPAFRRRIALGLLVAVLAGSWTWVIVRYVSTPHLLDPYEAGPLWPGTRPTVFNHTDLAAQLSVLLANPTRIVTLPISMLWHDGSIWLEIIGVLGWLNLKLPASLYTLWIAALIAASLADSIEPVQCKTTTYNWLQPPLLFGAAALALLAIYISQYLVWTPVGMNWIGGVQGRYVLPLIPLLALAVPRVQVPNGNALRRIMSILPLAAASADVLILPPVIVNFYHSM